MILTNHTHTLDRMVLSFLSLLIPCSLPVTILKTSLSTTNNGYLFFTHNRETMYNFLFLVGVDIVTLLYTFT